MTDSGESPFLLMEARTFYEAALQELWQSIPLNIEYRLRSGGSKLKVLSRGQWNHQGGPDFLNAKLEIDGVIRKGDVEIHCRLSDWAKHGHDGDRNYDNVILHVIGEDSLPGQYSGKIPMLPVFLLPRDFSDGQFQEVPPDAGQGKCAAFFQRISDEAFHRFASDAGLERMRQRSKQLLSEMISKGTNHAFLSRLFELIGIPGNREQFSILAKRVLSYPEEVRQKNFQPILWGEAGEISDPAAGQLLPDAEPVVRNLWNTWWQIRRQVYEDPVVFNRASRPLNSIGRRIAIIAGFVETFGENPLPYLMEIIIKNSVEEAKKIFLQKLDVKDPYWENHSSFHSGTFRHPAVLIGRDRIVGLLTDLLIPALHAYASVTNDLKQVSKIESLYLILPKTATNLTLKNTVSRCCPGRDAALKTTAAQQGLLHIRKTWCHKLAHDCKACPLAELY